MSSLHWEGDFQRENGSTDTQPLLRAKLQLVLPSPDNAVFLSKHLLPFSTTTTALSLRRLIKKLFDSDLPIRSLHLVPNLD
jgi:hypothetical protein